MHDVRLFQQPLFPSSVDALDAVYEVSVSFMGIVHRWSIDGLELRRQLVFGGRTVRKFAGVVFGRVLDEWFASRLGLRAGDIDGTGVVLTFVDARGTTLFGITTGESGELLLHPSDKEAFKRGAGVFVEALWSSGDPIIRATVRLTDLDDGSWGACLRGALMSNLACTKTRLGRAADAVSVETLDPYVARLRGGSDIDAYVIFAALLENVRGLLLDWPRAYTKKELQSWKQFVTEVVGRDITVLLAFCPRRMQVQKTHIVSTALEAFSPVPTSSVSRILLAVERALDALRKPLFSPSLLFDARISSSAGGIDASSVACAPDAVLRVCAGVEVAPKSFFVDERARDSIVLFLGTNNYKLQKSLAYRSLIAGVSTRVERWVIDNRVVLEFVDARVLTEFSHSIVVAGRRYRCQKFGYVAIHAIARLMRAVQEGDTTEANEIRELVEKFHHKLELGFPLVDGRKRRRRVLYFRDYEKELAYRCDGSRAIPAQTVSLSYTSHMHENVALDVKI
jgi:hypothetical protein